MTPDAKLLPCPFCGSEDIARADGTYGAFWCMCNGCGASTWEVGADSQAIADARWNLRASPGTGEKMTDDLILSLWNGPTSQSNKRTIIDFARRLLGHPEANRVLCPHCNPLTRSGREA